MPAARKARNQKGQKPENFKKPGFLMFEKRDARRETPEERRDKRDAIRET
jgi:hypothetical protein